MSSVRAGDPLATWSAGSRLLRSYHLLITPPGKSGLAMCHVVGGDGTIILYEGEIHNVWISLANAGSVPVEQVHLSLLGKNQDYVILIAYDTLKTALPLKPAAEVTLSVTIKAWQLACIDPDSTTGKSSFRSMARAPPKGLRHNPNNPHQMGLPCPRQTSSYSITSVCFVGLIFCKSPLLSMEIPAHVSETLPKPMFLESGNTKEIATSKTMLDCLVKIDPYRGSYGVRLLDIDLSNPTDVVFEISVSVQIESPRNEDTTFVDRDAADFRYPKTRIDRDFSARELIPLRKEYESRTKCFYQELDIQNKDLLTFGFKLATINSLKDSNTDDNLPSSKGSIFAHEMTPMEVLVRNYTQEMLTLNLSITFRDVVGENCIEGNKAAVFWSGTRIVVVIIKIDKVASYQKICATVQALLLNQGPRSALDIPWVALIVNLRLSAEDCSRRRMVEYSSLGIVSKVMLDWTSRFDNPDSWSFTLSKMYNHQASRRRMIDEEIEEFEASISGRAPMDEGSDVEVLDVVTEVPLSMVLPAEEVPVSGRRRTIVMKRKQYGGIGVRRVLLGIIWKRKKKKDSLLRGVPATPKLPKKKRNEGVSKGQNEIRGEELSRNYQFVPRSRRGSKQAAPVPEVTGDASKLRPRPVATQTEKGKGRVAPESSKVQKSKVGQRKMRKAVMVELGEDDPEEASKEIKKHMFQTNVWVQTCNKAMKSVKTKLQQAKENLNYSRGKEASLVFKVRKLNQDLGMLADSYDERLELQRSRLEREWPPKLAAREREKAKQKVNFQRQYDGKSKVNVRLKNIIDDKGYDPETLQPYPVCPELDEGDELWMKEGEVNIVEDAVRSTGGTADISLIGAPISRTVDGLAVEGSNEAVGGSAEEEGVTATVASEYQSGRGSPPSISRGEGGHDTQGKPRKRLDIEGLGHNEAISDRPQYIPGSPVYRPSLPLEFARSWELEKSQDYPHVSVGSKVDMIPNLNQEIQNEIEDEVRVEKLVH
ncbi:hypothetical protein GIB67_026533 [Kingdonia uniflora]|uniref:Uncharacterized protein n=1 Tax=Kingdonia uniflora TaxID=39325 RepID=A0A7J7PBQ2_9MAGN|nr:hypothetical protein GIB67_026533 [Kingdonia uniflora]